MTPLWIKSVIAFIHIQQAANGERMMKKKEAMKATGMAMKMRTKNQRTDHAQPRAIVTVSPPVDGNGCTGLCSICWTASARRSTAEEMNIAHAHKVR